MKWAFSTLPQKIRNLQDFPGIQVADEPPEDILKRRNWSWKLRCWDDQAASMGLNGHSTK